MMAAVQPAISLKPSDRDRTVKNWIVASRDRLVVGGSCSSLDPLDAFELAIWNENFGALGLPLIGRLQSTG
jgi:hypothetical protein